MEEFHIPPKRVRRDKRRKVPKEKWSILISWLFSNYLRPYMGILIITLFSMGLASAFNVGPLVLVKPVLEIIFVQEQDSAATVEPVGEAEIEQPEPRESNDADLLPQRLKQLEEEPKVLLDRLLAPFREYIRVQAQGNPFRMLTIVAVFAIIIVFLKSFFTFVQDYLMKYISEGVTRRLREDIYRHILELPFSHFTGAGTGKLMSYINNDVILVRSVVNVLFERAVLQPMHILALLVFAMLINWRLTLLSLVVVPFSGAVIGIVGKKVRYAKSKSQRKLSDINSILHETFSAIRIVRAFRMEDYEKSRFQTKSRDIFKIAVKMARIRAAAGPLVELLGAIGISGVLLLGGYIVLVRQTMDGFYFLSYVATLALMYAPLKRLAKANAEFQQGLAGAERVYEILHVEVPIKDAPQAKTLTSLQENISFNNVDFSYQSTDEKALSKVTFCVKKGQTVALVGHSGAGKSTAMDLLMRFYDVSDGSITIDGLDIRDIRLNSLREQIGFVPQDVILFNDTIRNNIAYGCRDAKPKDVERAAQLANAHQFIMGFEHQYDTIVGERGAQISGGQAQRISIARALFKDPAILIFDEATSSLDSESELMIRRAMENLTQNRTTFIIAHRLSTVLHSDQIIVLNEGKIAGTGTHEQLLTSNEIYRRLYELQFKPIEQGSEEVPE